MIFLNSSSIVLNGVHFILETKSSSFTLVFQWNVWFSLCYQVTAVGHAAILAAIKKYMPFLVSFCCLVHYVFHLSFMLLMMLATFFMQIPSSFSSERLDVVKLIKQTRKMGYQLHSAQFDLEDQPATISWVWPTLGYIWVGLNHSNQTS